MWWPWKKPRELNESAGRCEKCSNYAIIFLNGQRLLCWEHYREEMARHRKCRCHEQMGNDFYFLPIDQCLFDKCNNPTSPDKEPPPASVKDL